MSKCPSCRREVAEDKKFCSGCGAKIAPAPQPTNAIMPPSPAIKQEPVRRNFRRLKILLYVAAVFLIALAAASARLLYIKSRPKIESANNPIFESRAIRKKPRLLWRTKVTSSQEKSDIAVAYGKVFLAADQETFKAINAKTGYGVWRFEMETPEETDGLYRFPPKPVVSNGVVFAGNSYGNIYALDAATGKLKWKYHSETQSTSSPLIDDKHLYFLAAGYLNTLDINTGRLIDTRFISKSLSNYALIYRGNIYAHATQALYEADRSYIISTKDYTVWESNIFGFDSIIVDDLMYTCIYYPGSVRVFDITDNSEKRPVRVEGGNIALGVVYDGDIIIYDRGVRLFAMDIETSREEWIQDLPIYSRPVMADGVLYFICTEHKDEINATNLLTAFDVKKRRKLWEIEGHDLGWGVITIVDGVIYFMGFDGKIYAYG